MAELLISYVCIKSKKQLSGPNFKKKKKKKELCREKNRNVVSLINERMNTEIIVFNLIPREGP